MTRMSTGTADQQILSMPQSATTIRPRPLRSRRSRHEGLSVELANLALEPGRPAPVTMPAMPSMSTEMWTLSLRAWAAAGQRRQ
jgi:hypothetical protein